MSVGSGIEWTDATWNPVVGCTRASAGCDHCYAVTMTHRLEKMGKEKYAGLTVLNGRGERHFNGVVRTVPEALNIPFKWRKKRRVFVNSMSDLFHRDVPFEFVDRVFAVMALAPQHVFQVLTKRPERMAEYMAGEPWRRLLESTVMEDVAALNPSAALMWHVRKVEASEPAGSLKWPLPNVWMGTSCEDQAAADARIPHLLRCPAAVRFLSCEPLLGPIDLSDSDGEWGMGGKFSWLELGIHWVIVGGESGRGARDSRLEWHRSLRDQCRDAGVPFFEKQLGAHPRDLRHEKEMPMAFEWDDGGERIERWYKPRDRKGGDPAEWAEDLRVREFPKGVG